MHDVLVDTTMTREEMALALERILPAAHDELWDANSCRMRDDTVTQEDFAAGYAAVDELRRLDTNAAEIAALMEAVEVNRIMVQSLMDYHWHQIDHADS